MSERERFEAWVRAGSVMGKWFDPSSTLRVPGGRYFYEHVEISWTAWQAARSGQAASGSHRSAGSDEQNQGGAQGKGERNAS